MPAKQQVKLHDETIDIIRSGSFNTNYILDNIDNIDPFLLSPKEAKKGNAFFTPVEIAFHIMPWSNVDNSIILDLCAGIGVLSFVHSYRNPSNKYICVENNPLFVEIGKLIVPQATWICADVTKELIESLEFDMVISNPPFGAKFEGYDEKSHVAAIRIAIENTKDFWRDFYSTKGTGVSRVRGENDRTVDYFKNEQTESLIKEKCEQRYVSAYIVESFEKGFLHTSSPVEIVDLYMDYQVA